MLANPLSADLDHILRKTLPLWEGLRNQDIFITGGTGFFGSWLLESLLWANKYLDLKTKALILTRDSEAFFKKCPHLFKNTSISFLRGDIRDFKFPKGEFSHIVHAATDTSLDFKLKNSPLIFETITQGTERVLEFANHCKAKKMLFISSGAIYGRQPPDLSYLPEDYSVQPNSDNSESSYTLGKREAEKILTIHTKQQGLEVKIARCFSFFGPYLPLDRHYAIGNFIADTLKNEPIMVKDSSPYRSYLYGADLAIWLWTILFCGEPLRPYNVGSDQAISIAELAITVERIFKPKAALLESHSPPSQHLAERYVPDIKRAKEELKLSSWISLTEGLESTRRWHLLQRKLDLKEGAVDENKS